MNFANYARKSVYSDRSDSVDNQYRMAHDYAELHFPGQIDSFVRYCDEDFTGSNTNRPDLKRMLKDIKDGMIDVLIVYQLDRLSRDVRDFANIYDILEEHHVNFVSVKENIDTTTPIGKAMMYVTVVFAQMERETIAARVTDNMIGLAKKGYWAGGQAPCGYVRKNITVAGRQHVTIEPDPDGVEYVKDIFDTFLDNNFSLQSMETYYRKKGIRTLRGAFFSTTQLHKILTMPYCVEATTAVYDYYTSKGCSIDPESPREKWDGTHGVMIYGRSTEKNKKHQLQSPDKWLVCLGYHKPFLPADKWLRVQQRFSQNKFDRAMKYDIPLLKGVLRCSCGAIMSVSRKKKIDGSVSSWYYCLKRMRRGSEACNRAQIKIEILDEKVINIFQEIEHDPETILQYASTAVRPMADPHSIDRSISSCESKIQRLAASLALNENSTASKYIVKEIEQLDQELQKLRAKQIELSIQNRQNQAGIKSCQERAVEIGNLIRNFETFTAAERNEIARNVISKCTWDGETLFVAF